MANKDKPKVVFNPETGDSDVVVEKPVKPKK